MRYGAICAAALLAACSNPSEPKAPNVVIEEPVQAPEGRVREVGSIMGYNAGDPQITVAADGRTVTVRVTTYGGGCHSKADTQVRVEGMVADITPYDFAAGPDTVCTQPLLSSIHEATLSFDRAGTARIRIHGIDARANDWRGRTVVVERAVTLR